MLIDCHLHSTISSDAKSSIPDMCRSAIRKGFAAICFTEHLDMNPTDSNYLYYNHPNYVSEIQKAKALFGDKLEIRMGIEFSEPHLYPADFERVAKEKFDFILGSVHAFQGTWAGAADALEKFSADEIYEMHYAQTLRMVQFGGFDALAHMDFPRRYIPDPKEPSGLIDPILSALVRSNIALELNSSPLRKGLGFSLPGPILLQRYKELGGRLVTLGSDAHNAKELGEGLAHVAAQAASFQLEPVLYRHRIPIPAHGRKSSEGIQGDDIL
jgi:histidinol-phosphatase (PHP family)